MNYLYAFIVGGIICVIGQVLIAKTKLTSSRILVIFVVAGVILGALGLYEPLVKWAGAGATVPIVGFGYNITRGAIHGAKADGVLGALSGGLSSISAGISVSIAVSYLVALLSSPKTKTE